MQGPHDEELPRLCEYFRTEYSAPAASPNEPAVLLILHEGITVVPCYSNSRTETVPPDYSPDQDPQWSLIGTEYRQLSWAPEAVLRMDCRPAKLEVRRDKGLLGAI